VIEGVIGLKKYTVGLFAGVAIATWLLARVTSGCGMLVFPELFSWALVNRFLGDVADTQPTIVSVVAGVSAGLFISIPIAAIFRWLVRKGKMSARRAQLSVIGVGILYLLICLISMPLGPCL
jgi:hypothetical protein